MERQGHGRERWSEWAGALEAGSAMPGRGGRAQERPERVAWAGEAEACRMERTRLGRGRLECVDWIAQGRVLGGEEWTRKRRLDPGRPLGRAGDRRRLHQWRPEQGGIRPWMVEYEDKREDRVARLERA